MPNAPTDTGEVRRAALRVALAQFLWPAVSEVSDERAREYNRRLAERERLAPAKVH